MITASVRGGNASLRQGIIRQLVIRFELPEGLHIYGDPVPEGLTATVISVTGPEGLQVMPAQFPASNALRLESLDVELQVWSGQVDVVIPIYATGELASECRPLRCCPRLAYQSIFIIKPVMTRPAYYQPDSI